MARRGGRRRASSRRASGGLSAALPSVLSPLACAVLAVALLSGCAGGDDGPTGRAVTPPAPAGAGTVGAAATTTPAAELRAGLTWQLVERTHQLALLRQASLDAHGVRTDPAVRAVEGLLDDGAGELARTAGVPAVRDLMGEEVDLVLAPAVAPLTAVHRRIADRLAASAPTLAPATLVVALDRSTAGLGRPVPTADSAAAEVAAGLVANAVAAGRGLGSTETPAVVLRADLTRLLVTRTYLAGRPSDAAALDGLAGTLTRRLVDATDARGPVLAALRAGHTALAAAAAPHTGGGTGATDRLLVPLTAADRDLARRLSAAVPSLPVDVVARALDPGRRPLLAAVRARAAGDVDAASLSTDAASRAVVLAAALAAGVADQGRLR